MPQRPRHQGQGPRFSQEGRIPLGHTSFCLRADGHWDLADGPGAYPMSHGPNRNSPTGPQGTNIDKTNKKISQKDRNIIDRANKIYLKILENKI